MHGAGNGVLSKSGLGMFPRLLAHPVMLAVWGRRPLEVRGQEREGLAGCFIDEGCNALSSDMQRGRDTGYCLMGMRMAHRRLLLPEQITYSPRLHLSVKEGGTRGDGNDDVCVERSMQRRASEISHIGMDQQQS